MARLPSLLWLATFVELTLSQVAFNEPFQVVRPTANHSSMLPVPEGLKRLARHEGNIAVVAVVGPYHSGKSFLLNALLGNTQVFSIGRKTSPETMGIWLCRTQLKAADGSEVWLMDSEGFFGPGVTESYDAKIFTIATLLGGHLVYNTVKIIDQQAVNLLEMLARRAELFRTRSSAEASNTEAPEFLSVRSFPPLTWVVEDFVQELPEEHRHGDGATGWLMSYLKADNGTSGESGGNILSRLYSKIAVHTLFLPATVREDLQDLSRLKWENLTEEFKQEVEILREHIVQTVEARKIEGSATTGRTLERTLRFIVQALQRGMFHDLPSLWQTWTAQVAVMSLQDAETWFQSLITMIDHGDDPIPLHEFNVQVEEARAKATSFYRELLRDFEVRLNEDELHKRMEVHFAHKVQLYHERVLRWVGDLHVKAKEQVSRFLATQELPTDPDLLRKVGENRKQEVLKVFSEQLKVFSVRGPSPKLGRPATMPPFAQDPVGHLNSELAALLSTQELENEREILQSFKGAVVAADEAVESELRLNQNKLLGRAQLKELEKTVAVRCWAAFDEKLSRYKWMMLLSHYKAHKTIVQTDTFESKMSRFTASNEQKLNVHFQTVLGRCLTSYKTRKNSLPMPAAEPDINAEHNKLAQSILEMLDETSRDLTDTPAFNGARRRLNAALEEGLLQTRQKNVQVWKAHSDEATRCAKRANQAVEQLCGLTCFFNKVPFVHKAVSQKHLLTCFTQSNPEGGAQRMSSSMQMHVFEDWYNKDLAFDVSNVRTNFMMFIVTPILGFIGLLAFYNCGPPSRRFASPSPFNHGNPMGQRW